MRRISILASVVALVLSTGAGRGRRLSPQGSAAQVALDEYFRAWNAGDNEAIAAASNFPRLSIGRNGQVVVREGPAEIEIDFDLLRQVEGWHHTTLDLVEVVQVSDDKVHFKILSSRRRQDETDVSDHAGPVCGDEPERPLGASVAIDSAGYFLGAALRAFVRLPGETPTAHCSAPHRP